MDLSIIIVNYKNKKKLESCLASIFKADNQDLNYEIILVENNSGDDLHELVKLDSRLRLFNLPKNLGMGGGNNYGIERARGEYIFVLNPDTIIKGDAIATLLNYLKVNPGVGIVGPKLLNSDNSLQYSCFRFPKWYTPILRRTFLGKYFPGHINNFQMVADNHDLIKEVDWMLGSSLMFKKEIVLPNGQVWPPRFDERYFMYFEDTDICRTCQAKGLKVVYNPEAILIHDHLRQSARHPWYAALFIDSLARNHIGSGLKYFCKWGLK